MIFGIELLEVLHGVFVAIAVVIVTLGVVRSVYYLGSIVLHPKQVVARYKRARWVLCQHIVFGLEFMIAGDVVHTLLIPDYRTTLMLGAMVLIRTVLSYYVDLEMKLMEEAK